MCYFVFLYLKKTCGYHKIHIHKKGFKHFSLQTSPSLPPSADPIRPNWERNDGNDVSLDRENVALARTQSAYTLSASFAQQELRKIYQLIRDGVAH